MAKISIDGEEKDACQRVRLRISVSGLVQGVGFRPFVYRLAQREDVAGHVLNNPQGVEIEAEGRLDQVSRFLTLIVSEKPPQARIDTVSAHFMDPLEDKGFVIKDSRQASARTVLVSPDIATCPDCLRELRDREDRRYGYPFINCTNCGPRYTIIRDIPYDREKTTMNVFSMCRDCLAEYDDPAHRRFHAEPNACPVCGPQVILRDASGKEIACSDPIEKVSSALARGSVVAVKGLGGFHLAVDATNGEAVATLRLRKQREEKPFAIMARDIGSIRKFAQVGPKEEAVLQGPARPITLLKKRRNCPIAESVAPGNRYLGVMLPYTPVHHLLLDSGPLTLVMTSGNISEEPIAIDLHDALARLGGIVDLYLDHNRDILSRSDDSVVRVIDDDMVFIRRSRGWVPLPIRTDTDRTGILACGAHLKNTIALTRGTSVFLSQHIGDLENLPASEFFKSAISHLAKIIEVEPEVVAHDLHPDYLSTKFALELPLETKIGVQHHHAHVASCLGEAGIDGPVVGMALDGTGWGPDGTVWGGEVLVADRRSYSRVAHIERTGMPGGEAAVRQPWRMAVSYLLSAFGDDLDGLPLDFFSRRSPVEKQVVMRMLRRGLNCPQTSSCGRLFDAVSSLCAIRDEVNYEGQAAMELEMVTMPDVEDCYRVDIIESDGTIVIGIKNMIREIVNDLAGGIGKGVIGGKFHNWLVMSMVEVASILGAKHDIGTVALSGGCFQNVILLHKLRQRLLERGFEVLTNHMVPANDGGISFGQVVVASAVLDGGSQRRP